jgi:hypothetical protein
MTRCSRISQGLIVISDRRQPASRKSRAEHASLTNSPPAAVPQVGRLAGPRNGHPDTRQLRQNRRLRRGFYVRRRPGLQSRRLYGLRPFVFAPHPAAKRPTHGKLRAPRVTYCGSDEMGKPRSANCSTSCWTQTVFPPPIRRFSATHF